MKTTIKFLFTLLILFAFSCDQEASLDPIEPSLSQDPEKDFIDPSSYEVKENLTLAEFQAAEQGMEGKHRYRYNRTKVPVIDEVNGGDVGKATLLRGKDGVFVYARTSNLIPGHVYTLWWVIWNNPENCTKKFACNEPDFVKADMVKVEVMYASGAIARKNGKASFLAYLKENDASGTINPLFLPASYGGLLDSKKAEVHIVVRSHGPAIHGQIWDQLTSWEGGCSTFFDPFTTIPMAEGECGDIYAGIFPPPMY